MRIQAAGYGRTVLAIMSNRVSDDGPGGVSRFSVAHESRGIIRAVRAFVRVGVLTRVDAPRGELAVSPGPRWDSAS